MAFNSDDIDTFLKKIVILKDNYTLSGGAAIIWHLKHRTTDDLDLYLEPDTWDAQKTPYLIFKAFEGMVPSNQLIEIVSQIQHSDFNVTKVNFSKVTVSIIQRGPLSRLRREKVQPEGKLSITSLRDLALGKIAAMGERDKEIDLIDFCHIFANNHKDVDLEYIIDNVEDHALQFFSFEKVFTKLEELQKIEGISEDAILKIRQLGSEGLKRV